MATGVASAQLQIYFVEILRMTDMIIFQLSKEEVYIMRLKLNRVTLQFFTCALLFSTLLQADWNNDFDRQSNSLLQKLPELQNSAYFDNWMFFIHAREKLLDDRILTKKLEDATSEERLLIKREDLGVIIKKRPSNHIHDLFPWELSYLMGLPAYVLPAFALEIGGKKVIIQKLEDFESGNKHGGGYAKNSVKKVSLETFWKAHLQAYILGLADLPLANIGINPSGLIRFFDNEASLHYDNNITKMNGSFAMGYYCQSFDWPQYRLPLNKKIVAKLKKFIKGLDGFEDKFQRYLQYRPNDLLQAELDKRLLNVRKFRLEEGITFRDFFGSLYPRLSTGLDELNRLVSGILNRPIDHGTSIFFVCRWMKTYPLAHHDKQKLEQWIADYID